MDNHLFQSALCRSYFFLKFRPRTEHEMEVYLTKKGFDTETIQNVIENLKEQNLINDIKFVELFVQNRNLLKPKGRSILTQELLNHGIQKDIIERYFEEQPLNEEQIASELLSKKMHRFKSTDPKIRTQKIISYLMRRGFSYHISKKAIEEYSKKE